MSTWTTEVIGSTLDEIEEQADTEFARFFGDRKSIEYRIGDITLDEVIRERDFAGRVVVYNFMYSAVITATW